MHGGGERVLNGEDGAVFFLLGWIVVVFLWLCCRAVVQGRVLCCRAVVQGRVLLDDQEEEHRTMRVGREKSKNRASTREWSEMSSNENSHRKKRVQCGETRHKH